MNQERMSKVILMFHKMVSVRFLEGTALEACFQDGLVKRYDMAALFPKYPQLQALENRELFHSGRMMGAYGIAWNDELDIEAETIYEDGETVRVEHAPPNLELARVVAEARAKAGLSQKQVAALSGIDQSDLSKIERGIANPSISTLARIADALGGTLRMSIEISPQR